MLFLRRQFFRRKALTKRNLLYYWWRYISNAKRTWQARSNANTQAETQRIAGDLLREGIVLGPSDRFLSNEGQDALTDAAKIVLDISRQNEVENAIAKGESDYKKSFMVHLVPWEQEHEPDSPLLKVALDKKLLEIVSQYLGLWPRLYAVGAWINFPTRDEATDSQLWHRDPEDLRQIKVFIYLRDVDENCGPFSYIPRTHPFSEGAGKIPEHKHHKRITDEEMKRTFPPDSWMTCVGPAKTMILADTVGYHRGGKPTSGARILITCTYTSGVPSGGHKVRVKGRPAWATADIQQAAL